MIFTLEALEAKHGDCLLLHFGDENAPKTIVIDGGPAGVYDASLKPRLLTIKEKLSPDDPLMLSMVMVSHLDDDHVNGILRLFDDIDVENGGSADFEVSNLWVNTFDDIIGNKQLPAALSAIGASAAAANLANVPLDPKTERSISAVIASTGQGRTLRDQAKKLACLVNRPFRKRNDNPPLVRGDVRREAVDWDGLSIRIIHPDDERLDKLQKKWDEDLEKIKEKNGDESIIYASMSSPDTSPFNLSSIVCLIEFGGKKMLLTGDGRSDDIYEGLKLNNALNAAGKLHVDILKMPHHGSIRNMKQDFLEKITADHYVISADGHHGNPDQELLDLMLGTIKKGTIHVTNHNGRPGKGLKAKLDDFSQALDRSGSHVKTVFSPGHPIVIDLLAPIEF